MASKRRQRRIEQRQRELRAIKHAETVARQCGDKIAYDDPERARIAASLMTVRFGRDLRVYHCPHCSTKAQPRWHIGGAAADK